MSGMSYERSIAHLLQLLQSYILKYVENAPLDGEYWVHRFKKAYQVINDYEARHPEHANLARACSELAEFFGVQPASSSPRSPGFSQSFDSFVNGSTYSQPLSKLASPLRNYEKFLGMQTPDLKLVKPIMPIRRRARMHRSVSKNTKNDTLKNTHPFQVYRHRAIWKLLTD